MLDGLETKREHGGTGGIASSIIRSSWSAFAAASAAQRLVQAGPDRREIRARDNPARSLRPLLV
jgi:hypothetical protein